MPDPARTDVLTSPKNPRVRAAAALRERAAREETGLTIVDGVRELARALAGGAAVVEVFVDDARLDAAGRAAVTRAAASGASVVRVSVEVLARLAYGDRSEGVVATVRIPDLSLDALTLPEQPLVVVVEGVEKPGNLGAVLRSADAAGATAVIAADPRTDLFNPNAIRASLGTLFTVPVAAGSSDVVRTRLARDGLAIVTARVDAAQTYTDVDLRGPLAIVLGSEAVGLTAAWDGDGVTPIRLPMLGVADSLNVSIAAAVLLFEARRQRDSGVRPAAPGRAAPAGRTPDRGSRRPLTARRP
jgi:RNA methyltransferase, TrmH family